MLLPFRLVQSLEIIMKCLASCIHPQSNTDLLLDPVVQIQFFESINNISIPLSEKFSALI